MFDGEEEEGELKAGCILRRIHCELQMTHNEHAFLVQCPDLRRMSVETRKSQSHHLSFLNLYFCLFFVNAAPHRPRCGGLPVRGGPSGTTAGSSSSYQLNGLNRVQIGRVSDCKHNNHFSGIAAIPSRISRGSADLTPSLHFIGRRSASRSS